MNSINDFAALRPSVEPLDAATADELWARVTGTASATARSDGHVDDDREVHVLTALPDDRRPSGPVRRRQWAMAAAAALVVVGVGAAVLVGGGDPTPEALPAAEQPSDGVGLPVDGSVEDRVPEPPLLQVEADGWTMTSFSDEMGAGNGAGTPSSILAPTDSLDRWIRFTELPGDFPTTTLSFDAATDTYLLLTTGDGTLVGAQSWGFDGATFQQIATDALTSGTVPDGYGYLSARDAAQWNRLVFLEFSSVVPARRIGIVLSPGGASQMADGAASTAEFRIVDPPEDGPRIATRVDGFWGVNVIAHGFESDEELLGMLASLVVVDPARFDDAVAGMPTTVPVDSTTPDGSVVSPQCTVPEGCDGSASPRATLEARVAGEFPGDAVTVLSDMSTRS